MTELARRYRVAGRVQGVGFRAWVARRAQALGLRGWVTNLRDGGVEVNAAGAAEALTELESLLRQGPPLARVDDVAVSDAAPIDGRGFEIR